MSPADLDLLERRLGLALPAGYRALLLESATFPDHDYFLHDAARLLELNGRWRRISGWKASWVAIGEGFEGDVYFIDTAADPPAVYVRGADGGVEVWMPTLAELAAALRTRRGRA
jgi:hypothetical protein